MIDDHSRLFRPPRPTPPSKPRMSWMSSIRPSSLHGLPASLLSDNGAVFTATPRKGKVLLQTELQRLGIASKNSRPYHPQTCGKVERLHQTLKRYLATHRARPGASQSCKPSSTLHPLLQHTRPHRALNGRTPLQAYSARIKARPSTTKRSHHPLPSPPRQDRPQKGKSEPPPHQPTPPHRPRQSPQRPPDQAPNRRPKHPHHRPTTGELHPRTHPRPQPRLPTHQQP